MKADLTVNLFTFDLLTTVNNIECGKQQQTPVYCKIQDKLTSPTHAGTTKEKFDQPDTYKYVQINKIFEWKIVIIPTLF